MALAPPPGTTLRSQCLRISTGASRETREISPNTNSSATRSARTVTVELGKGLNDLSQAQAAVVFTMFCHRSGSSRGATKIFSRAELPFRDSCQNGVYDGSGIFERELELGDGEWFEVDL